MQHQANAGIHGEKAMELDREIDNLAIHEYLTRIKYPLANKYYDEVPSDGIVNVCDVCTGSDICVCEESDNTSNTGADGDKEQANDGVQESAGKDLKNGKGKDSAQKTATDSNKNAVQTS